MYSGPIFHVNGITMNYIAIGKDDGNHNVVGNPDLELREQDRWLPIANVGRLMKCTLPNTAKVSKDAKECMQECVSEFISFITSEASDKCLREKRKTINGEDILYSLHDLGFENYAEVLKIYLAKYREQQALKQERGDGKSSKKSSKKSRAGAADEELENGDPEIPHDQGEDEESAGIDSLAYTGSPDEKSLHSPDYFHDYNGQGELVRAASDQHNLKHELDLHENMPMEDKDMATADYRYGDFLEEEGHEIEKQNGKEGELDDLGKLGPETEIGLADGIPGRDYY